MTVLREQRQPHDCPAEEREVCTLCPSLLVTEGSAIAEDFATASFLTAVYYFVLFFILSNVLDCRNLSSACASDSSKNPFEHKRNP